MVTQAVFAGRNGSRVANETSSMRFPVPRDAIPGQATDEPLRCRHLAAWPRRSTALKFVALFLIVFGARLWLIHLYSSGLPYWDEWDEARQILKPRLEGTLTWKAWFAAHNEHRILPTRLLEVLVVRLNRQWDPQLQMVVNAAIAGLLACALARLLRRRFGPGTEAAFTGFLAFLFALPFGAENTLWGFQSQVYLLVLFSVLALHGLGFHRAGTLKWVAGLLFAVLSLFTMGSGLLAAAAVAGLAAFRAARFGRASIRGVAARTGRENRLKRRHRTGWLLTLAAALLITGAGLALNVSVDEHTVYRSKSLSHFLLAAAKNLAWPFAKAPLAVVVWLPLGAGIVLCLRQKRRHAKGLEFALAVGLWALFQTAAVAYARGGEGAAASSRHMDLLSLSVVANFAAVMFLVRQFRNPGAPRLAARALTAGWCAWMALGCLDVSGTVHAEFALNKKLTSLIQEENVKAFLATDDERHVRGKSFAAIPLPPAREEDMIRLLRDATLRPILPAACQPSMRVTPAPSAAAAFQEDGFAPERPPAPFTSGWGSFTAPGNASLGLLKTQPAQPRLPVMRFETCAHPAATGLSMHLLTENDARRLVVPLPTNGLWHETAVRVGSGPFRIEAEDQSAQAWLGFANFREVGLFSHYAAALTRRGSEILLAGLLLLLALNVSAAARTFVSTRHAGLAECGTILLAASAVVFTVNFRTVDERGLRASCHTFIGDRYLAAGHAADAVAHYLEALHLAPDEPALHLNVARALIAPHDPRNRQPEQAARFAERACALTQHRDFRMLNALAAIYAQAGRFPEAAKTMEKAIEAALQDGDTAYANELRKGLERYRRGWP